jgi:hypothetical protein
MVTIDSLFANDKPDPDESELPHDVTVFDGYEALNSLCLYDKWKGTPRERSSVTIRYSSGEWGASLNDVDNQRSVSYGGKTIAAALEGLDAVLCSGKVNWYYWGSRNGKKKGPRSSTSCSK